VLEDLDVQGLIQSGTKKRRLRLHDSSFSELRRILEWEFRKEGNWFYLFQRTAHPVSVSSVVGSTGT
jgi:hypothetical protein